MATQKNSVGEVQQAVKQGAITREYKADAERIIQALNSLRSTEIMSYLQYMQHQYMAVSLLSPGMKTEFEAHATQELDHANRPRIESSNWVVSLSTIRKKFPPRQPKSVSLPSRALVWQKWLRKI